MSKLPTRAEVPAELKWKLEDIFPTDEAFLEALEQLKEGKKRILELRGTITSGEALLAALKVRDEIRLVAERAIAYSHMRKDEDNANTKYQGFAAQAEALTVELSSAGAFLEPEILSLDPDVVRGWLEQVPGLALYRHYLEDVLRNKPHILPAEQEELLAAAGEMANAPGNIFRMFNNADLRFPEIKNEAGEMVELSHGRYIKFLESQDRSVREAAFKAMYETYSAWKNTLGATYISAVKKELYFSRARKHGSSLEAALFEDNVDPDVYTNLIKTVHDHLHLLHRYVRVRKQLLGLDELHMWDLYVPMVALEEEHIERERAVEMVTEGLQPLGSQYLSDLEQAFGQGWIDWLENRGKTSGAYSWGAYGVHPYVLMNYQGNLKDVFTLAHELGHAMHTYYSNKHQEYPNADYRIFVAEVASTLNEALLNADLLAKTSDAKRRAYLINNYLDEFRGTVFRQTMFAEFEMIVHGEVGRGEAVTCEQLMEIYYDLNKQYFGSDIVVDELIAMEWARIPHFYRPFYVYKYATGFSAAAALAKQITAEGDPERQRYLGFLSSGGSDYPLNLLRRAGVDLSKPEPIVQAMEMFEKFLDELEKLGEISG